MDKIHDRMFRSRGLYSFSSKEESGTPTPRPKKESTSPKSDKASLEV
jgi:hypothetical protein